MAPWRGNSVGLLYGSNNERIFARYVSYAIMSFPPTPTVLTLRETCLSCLVNTTSPQERDESGQ